MLTYAFKVLHQKNYEQIEKEEFEKIHNLFAAILSTAISQQLKQGLHREYIEKNDNLNILRGKLDINGTIKNQIQQKHMLSCEFDELSEDNIFNQILKFTANILIKNRDVDDKYKAKLRKQKLYFSGVSDIDKSQINWSTLRYQRNNQNYRMLMNICYLVIDGMLLSTQKGEYKMASFIDDQKKCDLYENFVREYYKHHYSNVIKTGRSEVKWAVDQDSVGIDLLPKMETDITLQKGDKTLIIDTKYYSSTMQHHFDSSKFRSAHMYQIYTYVKNYDKGNTGNVSGMLLYAKTDEDVLNDIEYIIGGNKISIKHLDLNQDFQKIKNTLNQIVKDYFDV